MHTELAPPDLEDLLPVAGLDYIEAATIRRQTVEILREELSNISAQRNAAAGLNTVATQALVTLHMQLQRAQKDAELEASMGMNVDVDKALKQLARVAAALQVAGDLTEKAIRSARLSLGSPTEISKCITDAPPGGKNAKAVDDSGVWQVLAALGSMARKAGDEPPDDGHAYEQPSARGDLDEGQDAP